MADRVLQRHDTAANWQTHNPVLAEGELGIITDGAKGYKIGDGVTAWNNLDYPANPAQVVQELGDSEIAVVSQKIITEKISNYSSIDFNNTGHVDKQGNLQSSDWYNSDYIALASVSKIEGNFPYMSSVATLAFYDSTKNYIGEIDVQTGDKVGSAEVYKMSIDADSFPEGSEYLIISISNSWGSPCYGYIYNKFYSLGNELDNIRADISLINDAHSSEKEWILLNFDYTENRNIVENGFSSTTASGTANIAVNPGEEYRLHTYTHGSSYQYAFYNQDTLVSVHNFGTISQYVEWNEDIVIPEGVTNLYVSCVNNNLYKNLIYKKQIIDNYARTCINSVDELGYFEECQYTPVLGKLVNQGCLDNITEDSNYGYILIDVNEGDIYHIKTGTTVASQYAYAFYKGPYIIDKFLQGQASTSMARDVIVQIPEGVDRLLVCFAMVYMNYNRLSIKKKLYKTIEQATEQIYPTLQEGYINSSGVLVSDSNFSYAEVEGGGSFRYRGGIYGGSCHHVGYTIDGVYYGISIGVASDYRSIDEVFNVPSNAEKTIFNFSNTYLTQYGSAKIERVVPISNDTKLLNLKGKKYACLGDSITANDYCRIGTMVGNLLEADIIGNFAVGGATCADAVNGSDIDLAHTNNSQIGDSDVNVLSNQVRRLIANSTPSGEQITWTHPIDGQFNIDTSYGTGKGNTEDIPDIIYIAIGINDGGSRTGAVTDDTDTVFEQTYSNLTRKSIASALRWAIETLQSAYPSATIFVATPLWTASQYNYANTSTVLLKREIIMKTAGFCGVRVIDSTYESGYTKMAANYGSDEAKIHPDIQWRYNIAKYVANELNNRYTATNTTIFNGIIK